MPPSKTSKKQSGTLNEQFKGLTLEQLTQLANMTKINKHPLVPLHALPSVKKFKDSSANDLTRSIEAFIRLTGNYADRINNTGIYDPRTKRFRKGGTRKGIADIIASKMVEHGGRKFAVNVAIEVKVGRDKLSEHQIRIKQDIEQAGGYYIVARDWPTFIEQWDAIT